MSSCTWAAPIRAVRHRPRAPHRAAVVATAGRDGCDSTDGQSLRVRGTYRAGEVHAALDIVAHGGGSFIARRDNPGECPGDGWQAQSLPRRRRANAGCKANRARRASAPHIVGWDIDRDSYTVAALLSDQTRSEPLDLHRYSNNICSNG